MEGERSDGTSYLNNLPKPIRHTSLLYIGCFLHFSGYSAFYKFGTFTRQNICKDGYYASGTDAKRRHVH